MGCNLITGSGFDMSFGGTYGMAWLGLVILTFIIMFARRWLSEEMEIPFNWMFAAIGAGLTYLITISISCSFKISFILGLVGLIIGGFGLGYFFQGGEY